MSNQKHKASKKPSSSLMYILLGISSLVFIGLFFSITNFPNDYNTGPGTSSIISSAVSETRALSQKIYDWLPRHHFDTEVEEELPDWNQEFWTPTNVEVEPDDSTIILCKLNFKKYWENPHSYPMFKDLEGMSGCFGRNRRRERLSVLLKEIKDAEGTPAGKVVKPTGFVFHESRVGSTLIANMLASDPWSLVFSESTPMANAILHCETCTHEQHVKLFRDVATLMGHSPIHKRLFFKFQSATTTQMEIALEAFPETNWAFVFRQPVQTMMSHLDPKKGSSSAPCLRSKRSPPEEVSAVIQQYGGKGRAPNEAWCAAHLNMLCTFALRAYEKYGTRSSGTMGGAIEQRGLLINYESLPGLTAQVLIPLFGTTPSDAWLTKMQAESKHYSKSRGGGFRLFFGDSKDKDERATDSIQKYGMEILQPTYEKLNTKSKEGLQRISPNLYNLINENEETTDSYFHWKLISTIPNTMKVTKRTKTLRSMLAANSVSAGSSDQEQHERPNSNNEHKLRYEEHENGEEHNEAERIEDGSNSNSNNSEEEDDDKEDVIKHSHALKEKMFVPWVPFANHHSSRPYEQINCPMEPPTDYPNTYFMTDIVSNWNTDNTEIPEWHYDSLCHFDYQNATQLKQAYNYRAQEVPFVVYNVPEIDEVVKKWSDIDYLSKLLGKRNYRTETSVNNHFMYWRSANGNFLRSAKGKNWKEPTKIINTKFENWLEIAIKGQNKTLEDRKHEYFRVSSDLNNNWLFDELPFFKPKKSLFMVNPREQKGIHCRFGMRSVIAEAHFDGSRNSVVMLGGLRRWILTHPNQCTNMHMLPHNHPSGRHSEVDWSNPDVEKFPNFKKVRGNEVILAPGDFLFVPTYWIHYIISLNVNFQCNSRSGIDPRYDQFIRDCGF